MFDLSCKWSQILLARPAAQLLPVVLLHGGDQFELRSPLYFCRHVYKFIIDRPITFADYAYYNPDSHEALSKLCRDGTFFACKPLRV